MEKSFSAIGSAVCIGSGMIGEVLTWKIKTMQKEQVLW